MTQHIICIAQLGLVFGRLLGIGKNTLKTDVIHLFEGCNLSTDDVKVEYSRAYNPIGVYVHFFLLFFSMPSTDFNYFNDNIHNQACKAGHFSDLVGCVHTRLI